MLTCQKTCNKMLWIAHLRLCPNSASKRMLPLTSRKNLTRNTIQHGERSKDFLFQEHFFSISQARLCGGWSSHTILFFILRHVIVGRNFGSYVTHETKHFIYFYLGQVAILMFKSG
mmetsp:Transcript_37390/g.57384  ORF Transcript_37390/g.57384 Transcript_37390/m.57384 type:complete len:116 (+) Transcript_37390:135-482(+)